LSTPHGISYNIPRCPRRNSKKGQRTEVLIEAFSEKKTAQREMKRGSVGGVVLGGGGGGFFGLGGGKTYIRIGAVPKDRTFGWVAT